ANSCNVSELPSIVDVAWLEAELRAEDLFLGDVRGPNAHARGHIPGSKPLVLGSPPPMSDREVLEPLASEVGLRLRRHGVTGEERLVLYDRGDGVGAMPAAQMAELAGHPRVAVLRGGVAAWPHELEVGQVELHPVKTTFEPRFDAIPTRAELAGRLDDETLMILDVRTEDEFRGKHGYPCDRRRSGRRRRLLPLGLSLLARDVRAPKRRLPSPQLRRLVARVVASQRPAARAGLGRRAYAFCAIDEAGAHVPAELVPLVDSLPGLREQHVLVDRKVFLFLDPVLHLGEGHLRMKLDAPRVLAEPEPLRADPIPRELDSARRDPVVVVVPLEGFEGVW